MFIDLIGCKHSGFPARATPSRNPIRAFVLTSLLFLVGTAIGLAQPAALPNANKYVLVDKTNQLLTAYEGDRLVFSCRISTGRQNLWTPNGDYHAGDKYLMHYSTLFHHAAMPYSVQVNGNIFIHGFADVPPWPASHGCIRMPLDGGNPARKFFYWVNTGTPIRIIGEWTTPPDRPAGVIVLGPLK
jgi:hypothetical protein